VYVERVPRGEPREPEYYVERKVSLSNPTPVFSRQDHDTRHRERGEIDAT